MTQSTVSNKIPGPRSLPLLGVYGNLLQFIRQPMGYMQQLYQRYGEVVTVARGSTDFVFGFGSNYNQQVLTDLNLFYADDIDTILIFPKGEDTRCLSGGLHMLNGAKHAQHRRLMTPAFHKKKIEVHADDIVALTEQQISKWQFGEQRDFCAEMKELTMAIGIKTQLGLNPHQEGKLVGDWVDRFMSHVFSVPTLAFPVNLPGTSYYKMLKLAKNLKMRLQAMIERKRMDTTETKDILSLLINAHDEDNTHLSNVDLIGHTITIFRGTYPSTTLALAWTMFLLSQHPQQLANVVDELTGVLGGQVPSVEQLPQLPLLEGAIKESMRLFPPALWLIRITTAPCEMGGYTVPKGSHVLISPFITHRLPAFYDDPNKFKAERWLNIKPSAYEYLPFSAGKRRCLGDGFAMMSMQLILAIMLQRYNLLPVSGAKIECGGVRGPEFKRGLPMIIQPQNRTFNKSVVRGNVYELVDLS